jgi:hypothetical protein
LQETRDQVGVEATSRRLRARASAMVAVTRRLNPQASGSRLDDHLDATIATLIQSLEP